MQRTRRVIAISAVLMLGVIAAGCLPEPPPAGRASDACAYRAEIADVWQGTGDVQWAIDTAWRESKCDPCAFWPGRSDCHADPRTARGIMQLLNHRDLEDAARGVGLCPEHGRWSDLWCGLIAAKFLYDGSGRAPWR